VDDPTPLLIDAVLAAHEVVDRLGAEIRGDVDRVLVNGRKHLATDRDDFNARARLGLILLMLFQDDDAYRELQQVFLRRPAWRPSLRILVNAAKRWRERMTAHMVKSQ
jgi:hypothetical protein